ncbi:MAG: hypothetical protein H6974_00270 [Gammaproteobacteria bacterium]|nr:hypothetical protein [Gammaproteobacteria bacterium]
MSDSAETRRERLRELQRQRRAAMAEPPVSVPESQAPVTASESIFSEVPLLKRLLKSPDIREALLAWLLQNQRVAALGVDLQVPSARASGFDHMQRREEWATSSSPEEIVRYCQQLEHRADWLEATLTETLLELERAERFRATLGVDVDHGASAIDPPAA